jgi:CubicO group peptidase (beta-lactamase class C family)
MSAFLLHAALLAGLQGSDPTRPELADLTERWRGAMEACGVPAMAMVLVEGDEIVHRVTLGRRDPARDAPVTKDTLFYIASTTKPFVAFGLALLAEEGKVELDAPVKRYLPRFRLADAALTETLTVRDLLCHRHGLDSGQIVMLDAYTGEITEERYYHFLAEVESPGKVAYSNVHFTLAGRVIEAVSGKPWRDFLAARLFAPAGMTRTTGYADWMYAQDDVAIPAMIVEGRPQATPVRKSDRTMHAAGGLGTSIDDLARWLRLQLGRGTIDGHRILSERATEASWELASGARDDADFGSTDGFALGWQRGHYRSHLELRHSGGYIGAASYACFLPELGLGLGVLATGGAGAGGLCRLVSSDVHERLLADDEVQDLLPTLLERARAERKRDDERAAAATKARHPLQLSLPLPAYAGVYRNEWLGTLTIEVDGAGLRAHLGELPCTLTTSAPDVLRLASSGSFDGPLTLETSDGRVEALTMDLFGPARFAR